MIISKIMFDRMKWNKNEWKDPMEWNGKGLTNSSLLVGIASSTNK